MEKILRSCALLALVLGLAAALLVAVAAPGYRFGWWDLGVVFRWLFRFAAWGGLAAVATGLIALAGSLLGRSDRAVAGAVGLVLGLLAAAVPLGMRYQARQVPPIHDITTSIVDPPAFRAVLPLRAGAPNPAAYDPVVADAQREAYPDIVTIRVREPMAEVFEAAREAVEALDWELVEAGPVEGRLEATETTTWFGFKDDVVVRIREAGSVTEVDVRSKSRVGRSDLGANADRIRRFRNELLRRLTAD